MLILIDLALPGPVKGAKAVCRAGLFLYMGIYGRLAAPAPAERTTDSGTTGKRTKDGKAVLSGDKLTFLQWRVGNNSGADEEHTGSPMDLVPYRKGKPDERPGDLARDSKLRIASIVTKNGGDGRTHGRDGHTNGSGDKSRGGSGGKDGKGGSGGRTGSGGRSGRGDDDGDFDGMDIDSESDGDDQGDVRCGGGGGGGGPTSEYERHFPKGSQFSFEELRWIHQEEIAASERKAEEAKGWGLLKPDGFRDILFKSWKHNQDW